MRDRVPKSLKKGTVAKGVLLRETENLDMSARLGPVPHREVYCFNI